MPHFLNLLSSLEACRPGNETTLAPVLSEIAARLRRRGLVILISDAFDELASFLNAIRYLRHRKQEVRLFQILDPKERAFPFKGMVEFVGLEREPRLKLDGDRVREHYRRVFDEHQAALKSGCHACGALLCVRRAARLATCAEGRATRGSAGMEGGHQARPLVWFPWFPSGCWPALESQ